MKMMKYRKIVISVMILFMVFSGCFILETNKTTVKTKSKEFFADKEITKKCTGKINETKILNAYNFDAVFTDKGNSIKVTVKPEEAQLKKTVFKLTKINNKVVTSNMTVSSGKSLTIKLSSINNYKNNGDNDASFEFSGNDIVINDCITKTTFNFDVEGAFGGKIIGAETPGGDSVDIPDLIGDSDLPGEIDCSNTTDPDEKEYCKVQKSLKGKKVTKLGDKSSEINSAGKFTGSNIALKCDMNTISNNSPASGDYFTNVTTMSASKEEEVSLNEKYEYRFAPGNYFYDSYPLQCKIKCTENVTIEYGPPVAMKAGGCFEYEIQVTSHVKCSAVKLPSKPKQFKGYCDPRPRCVHKGGKVLDRAGPDDDFDECVENCDGGKYSEKCSKKCYKKTYGDSKKKTANDLSSVTIEKVSKKTEDNEQLKECKKISMKYGRFNLNRYKGSKPKDGFYGCYYWDGNSIKWSGDGADTPARFYPDEDPSRNYSKYTVSNEDGFIRRIQKGGPCGADCHYSESTCDQYRKGSREQRLKNEYLNPGVAKEDNIKNKQTYERAVKQCKQHAIEKVTISTFILTADGVKPKGADILKTNDGANYNEKIKSSTYINKFNGLYKKGDIKNKWYQTKWGFGGSWIHTKTGELSFVKPANPNEWKERKGNYCIPLDKVRVNPKWWNYYYTNLYGDEDNKTVSVNGNQFGSVCQNKGTSSKNASTCNWKVNSLTKEDKKNIKWNIKGEARKFGFFEWNIDVECFYATNNNICSYSDGKSNDTSTIDNRCKSDGEYTIRTVDLANLFPAADGSRTDSSNTGRVAGFNWTSFANDTKTTSSSNVANKINYDSFPSRYMKWVQKKNYTIYSDRYLDYEVDLTRDAINKIKKQDITNYADFKGSVAVNNVVNYKSNLLRGNILGNNSHYPNNKALKCNNMQNYKTSECETIE